VNAVRSGPWTIATASTLFALSAPAQHAGHQTPQTAAPAASGDAAHGAMKMGPMQGGQPPPDARDPDYSQAIPRAPAQGMAMVDAEPYGTVLFDKLEFEQAGGDDGALRVDGRAWYGGDLSRVFVKWDGGYEDGRLGSTRTELLWHRFFATFWGTQLGVRRDLGGGARDRNWLAFGVEGLAPYWFDVELTAYVGDGGRVAARGEVSYDIRFTQRVVLTSNVELNAFGQPDPARGVGQGLSEAEGGLRLRYEITREFAPYFGLTYRRSYGRTAVLVRAAGARSSDARAVVGVRASF
jgi:copper resistance protein B